MGEWKNLSEMSTIEGPRHVFLEFQRSGLGTVRGVGFDVNDVRTAGGNVWHPPIGAWTLWTVKKKTRLGMVCVKRVGCLEGVHVCCIF